MRIGLDGIVLRNPVAGSHRYFEELLTGLSGHPSADEYIVFSNPRMMRANTLPPQNNICYRDVNTRPWVPAALQQQFFSDWAAYGELDLLHSVVSVSPLWYPRACVATISDLAFDLFPATTKWTGRFWRRILSRPGIARAKRIIAFSESTKRDLCQRFGVSADKIRVIYPCTRAIFQPCSDGDGVTRHYHLPSRYILHVGTLEPRKNITTLFRAFAEARRAANLPHALVLAGQNGWLYQDIFRTVEEMGIKDQVIFLGFVPDDHMPALYSHADLLAFVSLYEGFGLPALEAMACGTPVLCSNTSSLPEVVGTAGVLVEPCDVQAIAREIVRILTNRDLRAALGERGCSRARLFSQERFIQETLEVYQDAVRA